MLARVIFLVLCFRGAGASAGSSASARLRQRRAALEARVETHLASNATEYTEAPSPCDLPENHDQPVCVARRRNNGCGGSGCWSCDGPLQATSCIQSSWHGWRGDQSRFADRCNGQLVRWNQDSGVQDCGQACWGCSMIRACCDTCTSILRVVGSWQQIRCTDVEVNTTHTWGVSTTESRSWERTEQWSTSVSATASAEGEVRGITGNVEVSAETSHQLAITTSGSWEVTRSESTTETYSQPALTCSWQWQTTIVDSCGQSTANSRDFIITSGDRRGFAPCCLPGVGVDPSTGHCLPDNTGVVVNLCPAPHSG